jgi:hypothetical protein
VIAYAVDVDVSAEAVDVEYEAVVDEIHCKPDTKEAESDEPEIFGSKQFNDTGRGVLGVARRL